jgi:hypothetical protein
MHGFGELAAVIMDRLWTWGGTVTDEESQTLRAVLRRLSRKRRA